MAADRRGPLLARVAEVKGERLKRMATEAHAALDAAAASREQARADRETAAAERAEARALFAASPSCIQARLWLDRKIAGETGAEARLSDEAARLDLAQDAHGAALLALTRHEARSEVIAEHHRAILRAGQRIAEDRIEADAVPTMRVRA